MKALLCGMIGLMIMKSVRAYPIWDEQQQCLRDRTFMQVKYLSNIDAAFLKLLTVDASKPALKELYDGISELSCHIDESWIEFLNELQYALCNNNEASILNQTIPIKGRLRQILLPYLTQQKGNETIAISIASAIWIYNIPYCSPIEREQLEQGNTIALQNNFDRYAASFMAPSNFY